MDTPSETKDTHSSQRKGHSRKKKKRPLWQKVLALLGILILLFLASGWGYINYMLGKINRPDYETIDPENFVEETDASLPDDPNLETLSPDEITLQLADQLLKDKDVINILLIGQDTQENVSGTRSDSMILATINQEKKEITVTSFMRDLYVEIPGYRSSRINTAYTLGGAELLDETIELNFGIHIDGNIAIDFEGFAECVDIIGGVDIEVTASEAACINKEIYKKHPSIISGTDLMADRWALRSGMQHLTGKQALQYARIREIDSDFSRTNRQRKLLSALFEKMKSTDLATMNELMGQALPLLTTDISNTKLIGYAAGILTMQPATFKTDRIPADGTYREAVVRNMQVLVPDLAKNQQHLKESLYGSDSTSYVPIPSTRSRSKSNPAPAAQTPAATAAPTVPASMNPYETAPVQDPNLLPGQIPAESGSDQAMPEGTYEYGPGMPSYSESQSASEGGVAAVPGDTGTESTNAAGSQNPAAENSLLPSDSAAAADPALLPSQEGSAAAGSETAQTPTDPAAAGQTPSSSAETPAETSAAQTPAETTAQAPSDTSGAQIPAEESTQLPSVNTGNALTGIGLGAAGAVQ